MGNVLGFDFHIVHLVPTLIIAYVVKEFFKTFVFVRKESLPEPFPFYNTVLLIRQNYRILDLTKDYLDEIYRTRNSKTLILNVAGLPPFIMTNDVANITHILKTNFENYGKSSYVFKPKFQGLLGDGIFNADGQQWFAHRKTSAHLFKLEQFKTSVLAIFNEDLDQVIDLIDKKSANNDGTFDFQDIMQRFTLESISKIAFGTELGCIQNESVDFAYDFDYCTQCINSSMIDPVWQLSRYLTFWGWKYFYCLYRLNKVAYGVIKERRASLAKRDEQKEKDEDSEGEEKDGDTSKDKGNRVDLLSLYLDKGTFETETEPTTPAVENVAAAGSLGSKYRDTYLPPTDKNLRDVFLNMIIAGRDTTANALSWSFFRLCIHPDVQKIVRDEVRNTITPAEMTAIMTSKGSGGNGHGAISYKSLQNMKYLEAFVAEILRLYPSVPKEAKGCLKDETLPDGTKVKTGDVVCFLPWVMGRDKELWGPDAEEFKPTRFLDQPKVSPFIYTAFQVHFIIVWSTV